MRHDAHRTQGRTRTLLLDCQSDHLGTLKTRLVVPLLPLAPDLPSESRLHPVFQIAGERWMMLTTQALTVDVHELGRVEAGLQQEHDAILRALDLLLTGV